MPIITVNRDNHILADIPAREGEPLLSALRRGGFSISTPCGGRGTCGKCGVDVVGMGSVMSCRFPVADNIKVVLPSLPKGYPDKPVGRSLKPHVCSPGLRIEYDSVPPTLSCMGYRLAHWGDEHESSPPSQWYGIAVDIGTTTVALYLERLDTCTSVDVASFANPQARYGHDVISRIRYVLDEPQGLTHLRDELLAALNSHINALCIRNRIRPVQVVKSVVVGNTTMLHLALGVNPSSIAFAPYTPAFRERRILRAEELGLGINSDAPAVILASVSGFIGADITAGVMSTPLTEREAFSLFIDLGTNGEIALGNRDQVWCSSTAAGPALEGATISCGVGGVAGGINRYAHGKYETIGGEPPIGICGSGLLDIVAELLEKGIIEPSGFMSLPFEVATREASGTGKPIFLTPHDIREVQTAVAAVQAGIRVLLQEARLEYSDIAEVYLAGAFGTYLGIDSAIAVGLLPAELRGRVVASGNAAGIGSQMALHSTDFAEKTDILAERMEYIELSMRSDFNELFIESLTLERR